VTLKIIVGLSFATALGALLIAFRFFIGPLLLAGILAYFLHPLALRLADSTRLNWRLSVSVVYLVLLILLVSFFTASGVVIVSQIESLFNLIRNFVNNELPSLIDTLSEQTIVFGPLTLDFSQLNLETLGQQLLNNLQSLLGQAGGLIGAVATGAAGIVGWTAFVLLVSYFLASDAGRVPDVLSYITVPGYDYDIRRMARELGRIWNAYLRGQFFILLLVVIVSAILMTSLGVRLALAIALLTGLARFIPYIGPLSVSLITFLVAIFQSSNIFQISPLYYALIVVLIAILVDQIFDNFVTPRVLGETLGVHPAAVLVAALVLAQLIGLIGLVLAAPVLASLRLLTAYITRKMFDLDPWPEPEQDLAPIEAPWSRFYSALRNRLGELFIRIRRRSGRSPAGESSEHPNEDQSES
jgi:predicted PurR-regulated permease PerM